MATCAQIIGKTLPVTAGEDSNSILPLLKGVDRPIREHAINQSHRGVFAIRRGPWKLIFGRGSGGWTKGGDDQPRQLYHLGDDLGETKNLFAQKPEIVKELSELMAELVDNGRSTPGPRQKNDRSLQRNWFIGDEK